MMSNTTSGFIDDSGTFVGCFSPIADRIVDAYSVYAYCFEVFIAVFTLGGLIWWRQRNWHPRIAVRGNKFTYMVAFSVIMYGVLYHQIFHLGESSSVNICVLAVLTSGLCTICFVPMFYMALVLRKRATYNQHLATTIRNKDVVDIYGGSSVHLKNLAYYRLEAEIAPKKALKHLVLVLILILSTTLLLLLFFCRRPDGECYFMADSLSRPFGFWFITISILQVGLWYNKIDSSVLPHSWGLRAQTEHMKYYVFPLLFFNLWGALDKFTGDFLDPVSLKDIRFTQYMGIDVGAFILLALNIHYQVYLSYDGFTKERLEQLTDTGMNLDEVLGDDTAKRAFIAFLTSIHSSESVLFYDTMQNFRERCTVDPSFNKEKAASVIFTRFIASGSQFEINIGHSARQDIVQKISMRIQDPIKYAAIFDPAMEEIKSLLGGFCLMEFRKTESYAALVDRNLTLNNVGPAGLI